MKTINNPWPIIHACAAVLGLVVGCAIPADHPKPSDGPPPSTLSTTVDKVWTVQEAPREFLRIAPTGRLYVHGREIPLTVAERAALVRNLWP